MDRLVYRELETYPHSTIDDSTVEWCPSVDGPATIGGSPWPKKRVFPASLACVGEVLAVHEETEPTDSSLNQHADDVV